MPRLFLFFTKFKKKMITFASQKTKELIEAISWENSLEVNKKRNKIKNILHKTNHCLYCTKPNQIHEKWKEKPEHTYYVFCIIINYKIVEVFQNKEKKKVMKSWNNQKFLSETLKSNRITETLYYIYIGDILKQNYTLEMNE